MIEFFVAVFVVEGCCCIGPGRYVGNDDCGGGCLCRDSQSPVLGIGLREVCRFVVERYVDEAPGLLNTRDRQYQVNRIGLGESRTTQKRRPYQIRQGKSDQMDIST